MQPLRPESVRGEPHPAEPAITFDRVDLDLGGRRIIEQLSFSVPRGQFVCVVGPSGCGKTTLLRMVTGLVAPTSGSVRREGVAVTGATREVAVVFQDYGKALLPWRTAAGNVALALEAIGMPKRQRASRVGELLNTVGLAAHAEKYPAQLSGGMQQRLQIARCLAQEPSILLMDEPFGALDAITRHGLQDEVAALVAATGVTVMFVTHDLEEAIYLGDRVISLRSNPGRLAQDIDVPLARPRDQLSTRENADFLRLRHLLFGFIQSPGRNRSQTRCACLRQLKVLTQLRGAAESATDCQRASRINNNPAQTSDLRAAGAYSPLAYQAGAPARRASAAVPHNESCSTDGECS